MPSYNPTWSNPYLPLNQFQQQYTQPVAQQQPNSWQPSYQQSQPVELMKVDGQAEAMNRLLMKYSNALVAGFVSEPVFDVNGKQFYVLSVDANSKRNLETFDYAPHSESTRIRINGVDFDSQQEFDMFAAKVQAVLGVQNGVHEPVQPAIQPTVQYQPANVNAPLDAPRQLVGNDSELGADQPAVRPVHGAEPR